MHLCFLLRKSSLQLLWEELDRSCFPGKWDNATPARLATVRRTLEGGTRFPELPGGSEAAGHVPASPWNQVLRPSAAWGKMVVKAPYKSIPVSLSCSPNAKIWQERGHFLWFLAHSETLGISQEAVVGKFTVQFCWSSRFRWESKMYY